VRTCGIVVLTNYNSSVFASVIEMIGDSLILAWPIFEMPSSDLVDIIKLSKLFVKHYDLEDDDTPFT
jgi:hypothetical protein